MAAPELRIVRRRKGSALTASAARALTAASAPVTDLQQIFKTGLSGRRDNWQAEVWEMYRRVPELRYYVGWLASSCSAVRLVASEIDLDTGLPSGSVAEDDRDGQRFTEIVRKVAGGALGQATLVQRMAELLAVPGEAWVAILLRPEGERWFVVSRKEIERGTRNNSVTIKLPDGSKHEFDPGNGDGMFRVWNSDAEDASLSDSAVRACLDPLREVVRTTKKIANADMSRLINNGVLFIPQEASLPPVNAPVSADKPGDSPPLAAPQGRAADQLQDLIVRAAETASKDESSMAALVPIVAAAPGDQLGKIEHLQFGKDLTETAIKTRNDAIARLAMGLNMSPEQLLGLSTGNHWSAFKIGDQDVQLHIVPVMKTICLGIYVNVLRGMLQVEGIDPDRYTLWFDTSRLTADPDLTDEARAAYEGGAITAEAFVRLSGLPDDSLYDLTTLEGAQRWARDAVAKDPTLFYQLLPLLDASLQALDFPDPAPALPRGQDDADDEEESGAERGREPDTESDDPPSGQAALRGRELSMAMELWVSRALEFAGKRRVKTNDHAQRARLRGVEAHDYHRFMPPVADAEVPGLIKGWDAGLDDIAARYGLDADVVRQVVQRQARKQLTSKVVDG